MHTFRKEERLCSKNHLDLLFNSGSSFLVYPFRVTFFCKDPVIGVPVKVVINVPKKRYKRAVDRNLLKRRIREVYRLNKQSSFYPFVENANTMLLLSIQFVGKEIYPVSFLEKKLLLVFKRLMDNFPSNDVRS